MTATAAQAWFDLPDELGAHEPPEARGLARDEVRLLVARRGQRIEHVLFRDLGRFLQAGDLVVVNTSATVPAAVDGRRDDLPLVVHFSGALDDGSWAVELRSADGSRPLRDGRAGQNVALPQRRAHRHPRDAELSCDRGLVELRAVGEFAPVGGLPKRIGNEVRRRSRSARDRCESSR